MKEWNPLGIIQGAVRERAFPRLGNAEEKRDGLPLRVILQTIPWNRISIEKEQDKKRPKKYLGESCYRIKCTAAY